MTIKQQGGIFGRNPTFNDVDVEGTLTTSGVSQLGGNVSVTGSISSTTTITGNQLDVSRENLSDLKAWSNSDIASLDFYQAAAYPAANQYGRVLDINAGSSNSVGGSTIRLLTAEGNLSGKQRLVVSNIGDIYFYKDDGTSVGATWDASAGNLAFTSGQGIDFSATSGTGTSELFDDYEEGTWAPELQFGGASTGITYLVQSGFYTKIGNIVSGTCWIYLTSKGSATGDATISGLPFSNAAGDGNQSPCPTDASAITFADQMIATVEKIFTYIKIREVTTGGVNTALTDSNFGNSSSLQVSFQYRAA